MDIFFDVDYTILGLDDSLRPGTKEVFQRLKDEGHCIYIWSGHGLRWDTVLKHNLEALVSGVYEKPLYHYEDSMEKMGIPVRPDFVVDDYPEVVAAFGGVWVPPYFFGRSLDNEMERVYRIIVEYQQNGHSQDQQFRSKGSQIRR